MSLKKDIISAEVQIGSNEAQANLTKLAEHTARLTNENDRLRISQAKLRALGKQNGDEYKQLTAKIMENNSVIKTNKSQMDALRKTLGLTEMSSKQLRARARQLRSELSGMTKAANPAEWDRLNRDLIATERQLKKVRSQVGETTGFVKRLNKAARGLLPAFGFAAVLAGLKRITQTADQRFQSFEERVDNLSALTGLEGEQLEWLQKVAKDTSVATVEGNIRIKQSADSIIDAYTKVGSKRPELLKVKEDLAGVTQEAIILSEAAKTNLEPAVAGLTMALNQFDLGADQSRRIINTLAAGSKEGAGNIPYLTDAMEKSGTTAKLMGLNIEQWAGAIEGIAPYYEEASMAGNSFDKVLLKLKEKQIGYVDGIFDLNVAIDQLKNMYASGTSSAEIFGVEHAKMAELLVKEQDNINKYTKAVTGSNTAIEQASKNTNNEAAKRAQAQNKLNLLYIEFGEKVAPIITKGINTGIELLNVIKKYRGVIIPLTTAVASYVVISKANVLWTTAQKGAALAASAAQALFTGNVKRATVAMKLFNTTTKLNPFVLIASLAAAAGMALLAYSKKVKQVTAEQKALIDVNTEAQKNIVEEKLKVEQLMRIAKDEKKSKEDRKKAIKDMNNISPEYLGNLTLEKINTEEADIATQNYIKSLEQKARIQAANEMLVELEKKRIEDLNKGVDKQLTFWQKARANGLIYAATGKDIITQQNAALKEEEFALKNAQKAEEDYLASKKELLKIIEEGDSSGNKSESSGGTNKVGDRKTVGNIVYEWDGKKWNVVQTIELTEDQIKDEIEKLEAAYEKKQAFIKRNHLEGKTTEDQYNADLLQAELGFLNSKLKIYKEGSKEYEKTVNQALEKQVEVDRKIKDLLIKAEEELASARIQNLQDGLQKEEFRENLRWENEKAALEERLINKKNLSDQELLLNNTIHRLIEEGELAHQQKLDEIKGASDISNLQNQVDAATPVDPNFVTLDQQQAFYDARIELIEAQYRREKQLAGNNQSALLAAERNYNKKIYDLKVEQIEAEYALKEQKIANAQGYVSQLASIVDEESALGKALFIFNKGLAIAEVWVNIAKANAKAVAASPLTGGLPWTAINTGVGVAQTAMIAAQVVGNFVGKKSGGYTDQFPSDDEIVDYVHANEFVASAKAVRNPTVKPILDIIDIAQKKGNIATLNLPAILSSIGRSSGGYGAATSKSITNSNTSSITQDQFFQRDPELVAVIRELNNEIKKGLRTKLFYREFEEYEEKLNSIRDNAQL